MPSEPKTYSPISDRDAFDIENSFYLRSDPYRLGKCLGQYELYKQIVELPGAVVECGVFKGVSLTRFATFRHVLETSEARKIIGFDAFGSFPTSGLERRDDKDFAATHDEQSGGAGISARDLRALFEAKGFTNFDLVPGNVIETIPQYLDRNPHTRIALLHLDMDVFEPTRVALDHLYDRIVPGGLILIDDYGTVSGATDATDRLLAAKGLRIKRAPYYQIPAYTQKPQY